MKPLKLNIVSDEQLPRFDDKLDTPEEIRAYKKKFVETLSDGEVSPLSLDGLKFLSNEELVERYVQIDQGAARAKWHICWLLRQRFESDKLFGQYVEDLNATQTNCLGSQMTVWRYWRAGAFCDRYEIDKLSDFNLSKSAVYELSAPVNELVAERVLSVIKTQSERMPVSTVKRLIEQSKAVATQEPADSVIGNSDETTFIATEDEDEKTEYLLLPLSESNKAIAKIIEVVRLYQDIISIDVLILELQKLNQHQ